MIPEIPSWETAYEIRNSAEACALDRFVVFFQPADEPGITLFRDLLKQVIKETIKNNSDDKN